MILLKEENLSVSYAYTVYLTFSSEIMVHYAKTNTKVKINE